MITISYELFRYILDSKLIFSVAKLKKKQIYQALDTC